MPLLFDNDWLRNRIEADPDDSELSAGTTPSPDPTPSDDLVARLRSSFANGDLEAIDQAVARIVELEKEVHDQGWNLGGCDAVASGWVKRYEVPSKELARPALYSVIRLADNLRDAEAENSKLRRVIKDYRTALRQVYFLEHNEREWQSLEEAQEHAKAECKRIDAALKELEK